MSLVCTALITPPVMALGALGNPSAASDIPMTLSAASATSPQGKMVIVSTNLRAAWNNQSDMKVRMSHYVDRLLNQSPYFPDILLLQEVKRSSVDRVVSLLSEKTGDNYVAAVRPPKIPWRSTPRVRTETDSGVIINRTTSKKIGKGGYISLTFKRSDMKDRGRRREVNRHARALIGEIGSNLEVSVASVHFQYQLLKRSRWAHYQRKWAGKVSKRLAIKYPGTVHTVGGDFNRTRCVHPGSPDTCKKSPFWKAFVKGHGYEDSIYKVWRGGQKHPGLGGVDFIFTKGNAITARTDLDYNKSVPSEFYSDHHFVWSDTSGS